MIRLFVDCKEEHGYNVFEFANDSKEGNPVGTFKFKSIKMGETSIRVKQGILGEIIVNGHVSELVTMESFDDVIELVNECRKEAGFKGNFISNYKKVWTHNTKSVVKNF